MTRYTDENDDSRTLQSQKAAIVQITKKTINNNEEVPEKSLGLRTKSILTQVSAKNCIKINLEEMIFLVMPNMFLSMSYLTTQL